MYQLFPLPGEGARPNLRPAAIYDGLTLPPAPDHRPYTILNMVSSVDGKTTLDGARVNELGSDVDHRLMLKLRIPVDAVIRGAGTVRSHGRYPMVAEEDAAVRRAAQRPPQPRAVIVTGSGDLPLDSPIFQAPPQKPIIIAPTTIPSQRTAALATVADVITVDPTTDGSSLDLRTAMGQLRQKYDIQHMLSEGGPQLNYSFLAANLLDELFWTVAPKLGGSGKDLTLVDGPKTLAPLPLLKLLTAFYSTSTGELFLRYKVR